MNYLVDWLQVSYEHRVDEYPERKLPSSSQVGWIADEVQELFPELVTIDEEGYQGRLS
jgi:hypothetical protein